MSHTYAGSNTFPANITLPDDGDPADSGSVNVPFEEVANRTVWAKTRIDNLDAVVTYGVTQVATGPLYFAAHTWATLGTNAPPATTPWCNPDGATPGTPGSPFYATNPTTITGLETGDIVDVEYSFVGAINHPGGGSAHSAYLGLTVQETFGSPIVPLCGYASWFVQSGDLIPISGVLRIRYTATSSAPLHFIVQAYCSSVGGLVMSLAADAVGSFTIYRARA